MRTQTIQWCRLGLHGCCMCSNLCPFWTTLCGALQLSPIKHSASTHLTGMAAPSRQTNALCPYPSHVRKTMLPGVPPDKHIVSPKLPFGVGNVRGSGYKGVGRRRWHHPWSLVVLLPPALKLQTTCAGVHQAASRCIPLLPAAADRRWLLASDGCFAFPAFSQGVLVPPCEAPQPAPSLPCGRLSQ